MWLAPEGGVTCYVPRPGPPAVSIQDVVAEEVVVRSGPAANFSALFEVHDGLTLSIVGRREGWIRVGLGGNWEGWVPAESVVPVRLPAPGSQAGI